METIKRRTRAMRRSKMKAKLLLAVIGLVAILGITASVRGRHHRGAAPVHGDARRRKAEFRRDDQRHAGRLPQQQADPRRIPLAHPRHQTLTACGRKATFRGSELQLRHKPRLFIRGFNP